jgi:hypothetical protein
VSNQVSVSRDLDWLDSFDSQSLRGQIARAGMQGMIATAQAAQLPQSLPPAHRANQVKIEQTVANAGTRGNPHSAAGNFGVACANEEKFSFDHFPVKGRANARGMVSKQ